MPVEEARETSEWVYWGIIVLAPFVIAVSLAGIYNNYIKSKKRESETLREDAERYYES
jgi:hypothetical protein